MRRKWGWPAVALVSITSNIAWFAAGRRYPNSPVGKLNRQILSRPAGASTPTTGS